MRTALCGILLFGFSLMGQSARDDKAAASKLNATLAAVQNVNASHGSLTQQLVDAMTSLAQEDRRPSRPTLESFADEFIGSLTGVSVTNAQVITLQRSITEVLLGSTTNLKSASRLREILTALHIGDSKVRVITKRFIAIGEEVRGPDDSPLRSAK